MDSELDFTQPMRVETAKMDAKELIQWLAAENAQLRNSVDQLTNLLAACQETIQQLKDEIAVLKGQKPRPKIPPNRLEPTSGKGKEGETNGKPSPGRGKHPRRKKKTLLAIHQEQVVQPTSIPEGAKFKGYKTYDIQDIIFESCNTRFLLARWKLPDGTYVCGELPKGIHGHYGPELIAYILNDYYGCRVTEPLLLEKLQQQGILISEGQLNNILIHNKDAFHEEKNELLSAGVEANNQLQTDDTGARHKGKNQYTNVIGNEWFSVFTTSDSKSRANFFRVLQNNKHEYLINDDALAYLNRLNNDWLASYMAVSKGSKFTTLKGWQEFLAFRNITQASEVRMATEAALFASVISNGIPRTLRIHADDARQFDAFIRSLCWIHEERHYRKIIPTNDHARADLEEVRNKIWTLYKDLKAYQQNPNGLAKEAAEAKFDNLFLHLKTSSPTLDKRLRMTYEKKEDLLRVLEIPDTLLHNNSSESDARAAVIKRKISGGTRSDAGRASRDTFLSLKRTCFKLGINFIMFLKDRVCWLYKIPRLAEIIRQRSSKSIEPIIAAG